MSIDTRRHIGPYLKIRVPFETVQVERPGNCCGHQRESDFCPKCGKSIAKIKTSVKQEAVERYDIGQSIDERLRDLDDCCGQVNDGFHYWMENGPGAVDEDKPGAQPVTARDIDRAVSTFRVKFAADIEAIEQAYNCNGEVLFGLLVWAS